MTIIEKSDSRISNIIGKKTDFDKIYRLSDFVIFYREGDTVSLCSTMTGSIASLSSGEWLSIRRGVLGSEVRTLGLEELTKSCILVPEETIDYKQYELVKTILNTLNREKKGTKTYTILPTTGCNARCVYCYEKGVRIQNMDCKTAIQVVDFITRTRWGDTINLIWFGGEPLLQSNIITTICRNLDERDIRFQSKIITNATMMTTTLLDEAIKIWKLKRVQVSVDGNESDYANRKRYLNPKYHNYESMMKSVSLLLENDIHVTLRVNYDNENVDNIKDFFGDIKTRFGTPDNLSIYLAMIFQAKKNEDCIALYHKAESLKEYLVKIGFGKEKNSFLKIEKNYCGADSGDKSVVIAPDGLLYHCEHIPGNLPFGSIFDPDVVVHSDERTCQPIHEGCKHCPFLPKCTPFFRNGCPDWFTFCRDFKQIESELYIKRLLKHRELTNK